jgi:hypothetical protein
MQEYDKAAGKVLEERKRREKKSVKNVGIHVPGV